MGDASLSGLIKAGDEISIDCSGGEIGDRGVLQSSKISINVLGHNFSNKGLIQAPSGQVKIDVHGLQNPVFVQNGTIDVSGKGGTIEILASKFLNPGKILADGSGHIGITSLEAYIEPRSALISAKDGGTIFCQAGPDAR